LFSRLFVEGWIATSLAWGTGGTVEEVDRGCIVQKAIRIRAIHPHWNSILRLSIIDGSVVHEEHGGKGKYDLANGVLTIYWERFEPDTFRELSGNYVHELILGNAPKLEQPSAVIVGDKVIAVSRIHVTVPNERYEVSLRLQTSDVPTFFQVFVASEYQTPNLPDSASVIVDLGANIGLAAVFFARRYPKANILCVEPEHDNFAAMLVNVAPLGDRVQTQNAAVWMNDGFVNLHTEDCDGRSLGAWGVQVSDKVGESENRVACYKLTTLLEKAGFQNVDILKVDIAEGAELELFSHDAAEWLPRIALIIVETHDRFRPGTEEAVRRSLHPMFEELPRSGENLFFRRRQA
jgi:FkbM family methyltransferase